MNTRLKLLFAGALFCGLLPSGCSGEPQSSTGKTMTIPITSTAFSEGKTIPKKYTCSGENVSPPLAWTTPPAGTKSMALICDDPDAPVGTWVHWVIYDLPPDTVTLGENASKSGALPDGAKQGVNDFKKSGYGGPCPPPGKPHRYFFKLYALDAVLNLPAGATKSDLLKAMNGHVLAGGQLMGIFGR